MLTNIKYNLLCDACCAYGMFKFADRNQVNKRSNLLSCFVVLRWLKKPT